MKFFSEPDLIEYSSHLASVSLLWAALRKEMEAVPLVAWERGVFGLCLSRHSTFLSCAFLE